MAQAQLERGQGCGVVGIGKVGNAVGCGRGDRGGGSQGF